MIFCTCREITRQSLRAAEAYVAKMAMMNRRRILKFPHPITLASEKHAQAQSTLEHVIYMKNPVVANLIVPSPAYPN